LDVDKAEAMAMMIAGIADFNFDMPVNTPALEFEPTPLAQMWGPLSKAPVMNKEGIVASAEGSRSHKRVRRKRASGPTTITKTHADITQHVEHGTSLQPVNVERCLSESPTRPARGQFGDEEQWFRELIAPDVQVVDGSREEIEMMESHQLVAVKEDTKSCVNTIDTINEDTLAAKTDVINEEQERVIKEMDNEVKAVELCRRGSDEKDGGIGEALSLGGNVNVVNLPAAGTTGDCYNKPDNMEDIKLKDTLMQSPDGSLENGNCVLPECENQLETKMPLGVTKEETETMAFETNERENASIMTSPDIAFAAKMSLEPDSPKEMFVDEKENRLSTEESSHYLSNCQLGDMEGEFKMSHEAIITSTVVDNNSDMSVISTAETLLQTHSNMFENETAGIHNTEVYLCDEEKIENNDESRPVVDAVLSHGDVSGEWQETYMIDDPHNVEKEAVSQTDTESDIIPVDDSGESGESRNEGEESATCFLQSMGQNDLSRYLTWNDDADEPSEDSVVKGPDLTLGAVNNDRRETCESEEVTLVDTEVSQYENMEMAEPNHVANGIDRGHEQPGTDNMDLDYLLSTYDLLPDIPENTVTTGTQSEAIGAEFEATVKELQLQNAVDVQKLINFNDDHFSQPELLGPNATTQELYHAVENRVSKFKTGLDMSQSEKEKLLMEIVQLRLQIQELQSYDETPASKVVLGHKLLRKSKSPGIKRHCDHCKTIIWCIIQTWYQCEGTVEAGVCYYLLPITIIIQLLDCVLPSERLQGTCSIPNSFVG
jgi:hypothetical protein